MDNHTVKEIISPKSYCDMIEKIDETKKERHFFAAANSKNGFVSYFDDIFGDESISRIYLLGGGPGSGKSTMMKRVAEISKKNGYTTDHIHCSSSPYSLDGVIIAEKGIAVIDGTAPHTYIPYAAGVREINIDPGAAWNTNALFKRRNTIYALTDAKKKQYRKAYIYLRAAGLLDTESREMTDPYILHEKLQKNAVSSVLSASPKKHSSNPGKISIRIQRAVSSAGNIYFESFAGAADKTFLINDFRGAAKIWFDEAYIQAKKCGLDMTVSYSPEDSAIIDGIYFPATKTAFTMYAEKFDKIINCERFADKRGIINIKQKLAFASKTRSSLLAEAYKALAEAGRYHNEIEAEYYPCTDYSITDKITSELCEKIFS